MVLNYYSSAAVIKLNSDLQTKFGLSAPADLEDLRLIEADLLTRELSPADLPARLKNIFGWDENKSLEMARALWQDFCGPIEWLWSDFAARLNKLGEKIAASSLPKIGQPKITFAVAVDQLIKLAGAGANQNESLRRFLLTILQGKNFDEDAVFEELSAAPASGGFGLAEEIADTILFELRNYVAAFDLQLADPETLPKNILNADEQNHVENKIAPASAAAAQTTTAQQQAIIDSVLAAQPLTGYPENIQARWRVIVAARVKGVRDATQTRTLVESTIEFGGLGLNKNDTASCLAILEKAVAGFENKRTEFSVLEKMQSVAAATAHLARDPETAQQANQKELNDRFVSMFGRKAVEEMRSEARREIQTAAAAHPKEHLGVLAVETKTNLNSKSETPAAAPLTAPMAPPAPPAPLGPPKYVPKVPEKLKQLIDAENPILPKRVAPPLPTTKVGDIKPISHLMGPIDELTTMSIIDWRRLSPDPSVRIQKIRSKIEVIAADGPIEKLKAIEAFEQSEPARVYRDILKQTLLSHKSVPEIISGRKAAGEPYLDEAESLAIKDFLHQIRYSSI